MKPRVTLGISGFYNSGGEAGWGHDPAAAIVKDGELVAAAAEERFVRVKHAIGHFPYNAMKFCLDQAGITLDDVDVFEMHEAFAAQVLATLVVLERNGVGRIPEEKLNVMGGSIALGHPFGATGARVVLSLANEMRRRNARYGLASVCAAGGNGAAIVLERAA